MEAMLTLTVWNTQTTSGHGHYRWEVTVNGAVIDRGVVGWHFRRAGWRELLRRIVIGRDGDDPAAWLASDRFDKTVVGVLKMYLREHPDVNATDGRLIPGVTRRLVQEVRGKLALTVPGGRRGEPVESLGMLKEETPYD